MIDNNAYKNSLYYLAENFLTADISYYDNWHDIINNFKYETIYLFKKYCKNMAFDKSSDPLDLLKLLNILYVNDVTYMCFIRTEHVFIINMIRDRNIYIKLLPYSILKRVLPLYLDPYYHCLYIDNYIHLTCHLYLGSEVDNKDLSLALDHGSMLVILILLNKGLRFSSNDIYYIIQNPYIYNGFLDSEDINIYDDNIYNLLVKLNNKYNVEFVIKLIDNEDNKFIFLHSLFKKLSAKKDRKYDILINYILETIIV